MILNIRTEYLNPSEFLATLESVVINSVITELYYLSRVTD